MTRRPISITLDEEMIARIDQLAADINVTRTAIIEQALKNDLPEQESFHESLENPLMRGIHKKLTSPAILRTLAKLTQQDMTDEEIEQIVNKGPRQREAAKKRAESRKAMRKTKGVEEEE